MILNEEQQLLRDTIKSFLNDNSPIEKMRELRDSGSEIGYSEELWQQLIELGVASITVPEEYGGLDFGFLGLGSIMEKAGHNLAATPILSSLVLSLPAIWWAAPETMKMEFFEKVTSGEMTLAFAIDEGNHHAPLKTTTTLAASGDGYVLNGRKTFVLDGSSADRLVVVARSGGQPGDSEGISMVIVDPGASGVKVTHNKLIDSRDAATIEFDNVAVPAEALIGELGSAWPTVQMVLDRAAICIAAEMLGGAQECFDRTIEYLKEREQFGVKIGSFQALQHRAAQMYIELESCRSAVMDGLAGIDARAEDLSVKASLAKTLANQCYKNITNEAVQMHGGMGVTDELDIGLFLKRARVCMQMFGDSSYHKDRYASLHGY